MKASKIQVDFLVPASLSRRGRRGIAMELPNLSAHADSADVAKEAQRRYVLTQRFSDIVKVIIIIND